MTAPCLAPENANEENCDATSKYTSSRSGISGYRESPLRTASAGFSGLL
jgi:hypothetical protein